MRVLLSIKPEFAEKILNGTKRYEFRKQGFSKPVDTVVLYATRPVGKIVGEFKLKTVHADVPEQIWRLTENFAGINKLFFDAYFQNRGKAYALEVERAVRYAEPVEPKEFMADFTAPQSYRYIP